MPRRPEIVPILIPKQETMYPGFPEAAVYKSAVSIFEQRRKDMGAPMPIAYRNRILLYLASRAHNGISLRLVATAYGMSLEETQDCVHLAVHPDDFQECIRIATTITTINRERTIQEIQTTMFPSRRMPRAYIERLADIELLKKQGMTSRQISERLNTPQTTIDGNIHELNRAKRLQVTKPGPTPKDELDKMDKVVERVLNANPKVHYADIQAAIVRELDKLVSDDIIRRSISRLVGAEKISKPRRSEEFKKRMSEIMSNPKPPGKTTRELFEAFMKDFEKNHPGVKVNKKRLAARLGVDRKRVYTLLKEWESKKSPKTSS